MARTSSILLLLVSIAGWDLVEGQNYPSPLIQVKFQHFSFSGPGETGNAHLTGQLDFSIIDNYRYTTTNSPSAIVSGCKTGLSQYQAGWHSPDSASQPSLVTTTTQIYDRQNTTSANQSSSSPPSNFITCASNPHYGFWFVDGDNSTFSLAIGHSFYYSSSTGAKLFSSYEIDFTIDPNSLNIAFSADGAGGYTFTTNGDLASSLSRFSVEQADTWGWAGDKYAPAATAPSPVSSAQSP